MRCLICQQWNVSRAGACVFCGNPLGSTEDITDDGRPSYERTSKVDLSTVCFVNEDSEPETVDGVTSAFKKLLWFITH